MVGMIGDGTISQIMQDIEASRRDPDRAFPQLPWSHFDEFGMTLLVFLDYNRERGEVYGVCLPTSRSTEAYWQLLEDLLSREQYPLVSIRSAGDGGHRAQLFAQPKDDAHPLLFDYFQTEFQLRKSTRGEQDDRLIEAFEMITGLLGKSFSDRTDPATD